MSSSLAGRATQVNNGKKHAGVTHNRNNDFVFDALPVIGSSESARTIPGTWVVKIEYSHHWCSCECYLVTAVVFLPKTAPNWSYWKYSSSELLHPDVAIPLYQFYIWFLKMQRSSQLRWNSLVWWKHGPPSPLKYTHTYTAIPHTRRLTPQIWHANVPSFSFREISCKYSCLLMHLTTLTSDEFHLDAVCARCFLSAMSEWKPQSWAVSVRVWVTGKINPTDNRLNFITLTHCFPTIRIYSDFSSSHINRCLNHC